MLIQVSRDMSEGDAVDQNPIYLLLESDALIALDMIGSMEAFGPCRVLHLTNPDEVPKTLSSLSSLDMAFLELTCAEYLSLGFGPMLSALGAHTVLTIGEEDEPTVRAMGLGMLARPFNDQMIHDALRTGRRQP